MQIKSRKSLGLGVATGVLALALSGLPILVGFDHAPFDGKAALADAGGNGKGHGHGNAKGHGKGLEADDIQTANTAPAKDKLAKDKLAKTDPLHPSNLGRLNGFMHASPQALANASPNSAVGTLSKTYKDALLGFTGTEEEATEEEATDEEVAEDEVTEEDLAEILAKAANKPLTGEQVIAIHEKLIAANPELAEEAVAAQLTDEEFADQLADEANEIQATEANQGLGSDEEDEADEDADDVADSDDSEDDADESDGVVADAADAVGDAAVDTADAIGDFFDRTF